MEDIPNLTSVLLTKVLLENTMLNPNEYDWEIQGFGMFRFNLSKDSRIQVWSKKHIIPNVSDIHDHPWDFNSTILVGTLINQIYDFEKDEDGSYLGSEIITGADAKVLNTSKYKLTLKNTIVKETGAEYYQDSDKVHKIDFTDGTITCIHKRSRSNKATAKSFYPVGTEWVSAAPRMATNEEKIEMCKVGLQMIEKYI